MVNDISQLHELIHVVQQRGSKNRAKGKNMSILKTNDLNEQSKYLTEKTQAIIGHGSRCPAVQELSEFGAKSFKLPPDTSVTFWCPDGTSLKHDAVKQLLTQGPVEVWKEYKKNGWEMEVYEGGEEVPNYLYHSDIWQDLQEMEDEDKKYNEKWNVPEKKYLYTLELIVKQILNMGDCKNFHWLACRNEQDKTIDDLYIGKKEFFFLTVSKKNHWMSGI